MAKRHATPSPPAAPAAFPGAFQLLKPSWRAVRLNIITLVEFELIPVIISLLGMIVFRGHPASVAANASVSRALLSSLASNFTGLNLAKNGVVEIVQLVLAPGLTYALLQGARGQRVDFLPALREGLKCFWRYVGVAILSFAIILVGFVLLIVPGLFMLRRYYLAPYYVVDRNVGVTEALRLCSQESKRFSGAVWGILGAQLAFIVLLIIPLIGWLAGAILLVMYANAPAIRYQQIKQAAKA